MNLAAVIILALDTDFPKEQRNCASRCGSRTLLLQGPAARLCTGWRGTKGGPKQWCLVPAPAPGEGGIPLLSPRRGAAGGAAAEALQQPGARENGWL